MKKLCIVFPTPEFVTEADNFDGGLASYLDRVSRYLVERGHEAVVLVAARTAERFEWNGVTVQRVPTHSRLIGLIDRLTGRKHWPRLRWGWQGRKLAQAVDRTCRHHPEALIQFPNYTAPGRYYTGRAVAVMRFSSCQADWMVAHGHDAAGTLRHQVEKLEREAVCKMRALFAPSRLIAERVSELTGSEVEVIRSPYVITSRPGMTECHPWGNSPFFLFFGSLSPLKGVKVIAEALQEVLARLPHWHFVFAGRDLGAGALAEQGMWPLIQQKSREARARVHYLGRLERSRLDSLVSAASVVVLPSIVDNMPNAVLEAMGAGKLVVGTRGSSIDEMITDGETGMLCFAGDVRSLQDTLLKAAALDPLVRSDIGTAARRSLSLYEPERTVTQLVDFYERALQPR